MILVVEHCEVHYFYTNIQFSLSISKSRYHLVLSPGAGTRKELPKFHCVF